MRTFDFGDVLLISQIEIANGVPSECFASIFMSLLLSIGISTICGIPIGILCPKKKYT